MTGASTFCGPAAASPETRGPGAARGCTLERRGGSSVCVRAYGCGPTAASPGTYGPGAARDCAVGGWVGVLGSKRSVRACVCGSTATCLALQPTPDGMMHLNSTGEAPCLPADSTQTRRGKSLYQKVRWARAKSSGAPVALKEGVAGDHDVEGVCPRGCCSGPKKLTTRWPTKRRHKKDYKKTFIAAEPPQILLHTCRAQRGCSR